MRSQPGRGERVQSRCMVLSTKTSKEKDGRWIGEVPELPGVLAYGETKAAAVAAGRALALRVVADRVEHGELPTDPLALSFA